ncbi:hypothetical protein GJ654_11435 [Rhodoblastus acidophilus]|uniref:Uncharacterized protein n=1 Tax=Rhodoblastus acidophilus TaxID=1074 RepID=A0A6N8DRZ0_RHOAC|nr:hypothetical protein [Rhodoblastus acidophilus]MCW2274649.1 hypothetical protein [Rhodoblastus acidophilus]MTV31604.1 hypothetical protein [Rhodoblastus acidophilus]
MSDFPSTRKQDEKGMMRFPNDQFGNRIPLVRNSALRLEDFRTISFSRSAKRSCGNRLRRKVWRRAAFCLLLVLPPFPSAAQTSKPRQDGVTVSDGQVTIRLDDRTAGAISSLQWRGKAFVDAFDHERGRATTSKVIDLATNGSTLSVSTQMAFWTGPGERRRRQAGEMADAFVVESLSAHTLHKQVRLMSTPELGVVHFDIVFDAPEAHRTATFEILTGDMPVAFETFWGVDVAHNEFRDLGDGRGEQSPPVMLRHVTENMRWGRPVGTVGRTKAPRSLMVASGFARTRVPAPPSNGTRSAGCATLSWDGLLLTAPSMSEVWTRCTARWQL